VLTTTNATGTNGLTCLPKHGGAQDNIILVTHPITDQRCLASTIARREHWPQSHRGPPHMLLLISHFSNMWVSSVSGIIIVNTDTTNNETSMTQQLISYSTQNFPCWASNPRVPVQVYIIKYRPAPASDKCYADTKCFIHIINYRLKSFDLLKKNTSKSVG
jgi:hypothetical protein